MVVLNVCWPVNLKKIHQRISRTILHSLSSIRSLRKDLATARGALTVTLARAVKDINGVLLFCFLSSYALTVFISQCLATLLRQFSFLSGSSFFFFIKFSSISFSALFCVVLLVKSVFLRLLFFFCFYSSYFPSFSIDVFDSRFLMLELVPLC